MQSNRVATSGETPFDRTEEVRKRLIWLTAFRTVATLLSLAAIAARLLWQSPIEEPALADSLGFGLVGLVFALTGVQGLLLRRRRVGRAEILLQVSGDLLIANALVFLTGGAESPFTFTYSLAVIGAAMLLQLKGALGTAAMASISFAALIALGQMGLLLPPPGVSSGLTLSQGRVVVLLGSNVLALFLIAVLASYLTQQLSAAGGRLVRREQDLRSLAKLQEQILACMPSGLVTCDSTEQVTYVNRAARTILSLSEAESADRHLDELIPGALSLGTESTRRELTIQTRGGERTLGLSVTQLEGPPGSALIVFQDLTALRRMEDELRKADRLAAIGAMAAQLAHEIRNPLAAMRGSAQLLGGGNSGDAPTRRLTDILIRESDRLSRLVEEVLRFARPAPPQKATVSLKDLVTESIEMVRLDPLTRGVRLTLEARPVWIDGDREQLRQVLLNLLRNAVQAAKPNGEVRGASALEDGVGVFSVWDSAGAIASSDIDRIFEPFFSKRSGGTGLGLSIAQSIVHGHGGEIRVSSDPQTGTLFEVKFPEGRVETET